MQRRQWLSTTALSVALWPWLRAAAQPANASAIAAPRWQSDPFTLGVASGQPRPTSVVLWTRLLSALANSADAAALAGPVDVRWELFADASLTRAVQSGTLRTDATRAHSVHVTVQGLQPGRPYWYRFQSGAATSPVGRTRTAPALDDVAPRLRAALASCQHYEQGYYVAHREIARQDLDVVLFAGDYIYETSSAARRIDPARAHNTPQPTDLAGYRARHAQHKTDPDLQAAHAAHPWICTWDDHEVINDYAADRDPRRPAMAPADFVRLRAAAYQAYFEHMPIELPGSANIASGGAVQIHDHYRWGQLADLWTLDCRQYRSPQACPDTNWGGGRVVMGCDALQDERRTMLGDAQERWLADGLQNSRRRAHEGWRLVLQSTQISSSGANTPMGRTTYTDAWDGYPTARTRLMRAIQASGARDVVTLGGDVHMNVAANLRLAPNDTRSPIVASEIVGTSITSRGLSETLLQQMRASNPDIVHARADERGYALVEVDPKGVRTTFRATPHPASQDATLRTQAVFAVQRGVAGVHAA